MRRLSDGASPHEIQPRHFPGTSGWAHIHVRALDHQRLVFCRDAELFDKTDSLYGGDDGGWAGRCFCGGNLCRFGPGGSGDIASGQSRQESDSNMAGGLAVRDSSHRGAAPMNSAAASVAITHRSPALIPFRERLDRYGPSTKPDAGLAENLSSLGL